MPADSCTPLSRKDRIPVAYGRGLLQEGGEVFHPSADHFELHVHGVCHGEGDPQLICVQNDQCDGVGVTCCCSGTQRPAPFF